jgi:hypothetical protein
VKAKLVGCDQVENGWKAFANGEWQGGGQKPKRTNGSVWGSKLLKRSRIVLMNGPQSKNRFRFELSNCWFLIQIPKLLTLHNQSSIRATHTRSALYPTTWERGVFHLILTHTHTPLPRSQKIPPPPAFP